MKNILLQCFACFIISPCLANTFYISSTGNDSNSGLSTINAWQTIDKVNAFGFSPGDTIAFEAGSTFNGHIHNQTITGAAGTPLVITSYGSGKSKISSGLWEGLSFTNVSNLVIKNIILEGAGYMATDIYENGIGLYTDGTATDYSPNITIDSVEAYGYGGWGLDAMCFSKIFGFKNLTITNSVFHDNGIGGLNVTGGSDSLYNTLIINSDVYVANCKSYNNLGRLDFTDNWSGTGIFIGGITNGTVEYCEAYNNGKENGSATAGPVGIFLADSKNVIIQYCKSHNNLGGPGKRDGGGFDLDQGSVNCIIQNCESYENEGAGYGLYQAPTANPWYNNIVRNNSTKNDGRNSGIYGSITFWGAGKNYRVVNAQVYGNSITLTVAGYALVFLNGNLDSAYVHDNTFCIETPSSFLNNTSYETPIPASAYIYSNTFPCGAKPQPSFIMPVLYRGAFAPSPTSMWTSGWTNYDPQNFAYSTIIDSTIETSITANLTLSGTKRYLLKGPVYVSNNAVLTIQAGALIRGDKNTANSSLIITKGARIYATGLSSKPIIFTSNQAVGQRAAGDWGGIYILGKAGYNGAGGMGHLKGYPINSDTEFGGGNAVNDNDTSGVLQYVRIEFAGSSPTTTIQNDGLTFAAVGRGTVADHIQVSLSKNTAFKWIGGAINCRYLASYKNANENWDITNGYHGAVQYGLGVRDPLIFTNQLNDKSQGLQSQNDSTASEATPYTSAVFTNFTEIGPLRGNRSAIVNDAFQNGIIYSNNSRLKMFNSLFMDHPMGVEVDGASCINAATGYYKSATPNKSPGNLIFKNNLIAGSKPNKTFNTDGVWNMATWFTANSNDSLSVTDSILTNPYKTGSNNSYVGDYRPLLTSVALKNTNWNDSSFFYIDSTGALSNLIACPIYLSVTSPIVGPAAIYKGDTVKYFLSSRTITGVLRYDWTVPPGATLLSGQGTDTIIVKFETNFTGGNLSAKQTSYCGLSSTARTFAVQIALPVVYTFIGTGNWDIASNWSNGIIPPSTIVNGSEIIIDHIEGGICILNVPQLIYPGGKLTVKQGKNFQVNGSVTIK